MNCKPGDLALIVSGIPIDNIGKIIKVISVSERWYGHAWTYEGSIYAAHFPGVRADAVADCCLRPIRDQPGNEDFVTKARKTLPRAKPVTGPVTINARGEVEA
jgi:hypothetical protein